MTAWILRVDSMDARLLMALAHRRTWFLSRFFRLYTHLGDAPVPVGFAALLLFGGIPAWQPSAGHSTAALVVAFLLSQLVKRIVTRPRPRLPEGFPLLVQAPDRFSFPSGHATASMAVILPVTLTAGFGVGMLLLPPVLLIGVSRCYLGVHYPGDVLSGWGLALLAVFSTGHWWG